MDGFNLDTAVQVDAFEGGAVALVLAALQMADTWLSIGEKMRKLQRERKQKLARREYRRSK